MGNNNMSRRKTKIKGIHVTLDEDDLERLRLLMEYYNEPSHTQMIRMLIRWEMQRVISYVKQRRNILQKLEKYGVE